MKLTSPRSKGVGKLGDSVYSVNHGVQIQREYNPHVSNPSTDAQVSQRARFKLASQVSAALENVIAIPRKGILSPRNRFVKQNMSYFYGDSAGAQVSYENLQLTIGAKGLPGVTVNRLTSGKLAVELERAVYPYYTHVAYCVFLKNDDGTLMQWDSVIVELSEGNDGGYYPFDGVDGNLVIYAYGYSLRNAKAKAKYDSYQVKTASDMATLIANRRIEMSDVYFTNTRGTSLAAGSSENTTAGEGNSLLYISTNWLGSVGVKIGQQTEVTTQQGTFQVPLGSSVMLTAKDIEGQESQFSFIGWFRNGEQEPFSTARTYTYVQSNMTDIVARWNNYSGLE